MAVYLFTKAISASIAGTFYWGIGLSLGDIDSDVLPLYAQSQVDTIVNTLNEIQNSQSVSLAFLTDIHVNGSTMYDSTQRAMYVSALAINEIAKKIPFDFVMCNGDYLYNSTSSTKANMINYYTELSKAIRKINIPVFLGKGNHDINDIASSSSNYLTDEELYKSFLKYTTLKYNGNYGHLQDAYGYYDIPNKKIRFIFINTVDVNSDEQHTTGVSNEQVKFITNALKIIEPNWGVVFFSHHPLQSGAIDPTNTTSSHLNPNNGGSQLLGVINAYINSSTYTNASYDIDVDYTQNGSNEIIAMISGHSHRDRGVYVNDILMVSTTSASYKYDGKNLEGTKITRTAGTASETSWDIITIDRQNEILYMTRYGAGSVLNRQYSYHPEEEIPADEYELVPENEITENTNPHQEGWYEIKITEDLEQVPYYDLTDDTSPIEGKEYYRSIAF